MNETPDVQRPTRRETDPGILGSLVIVGALWISLLVWQIADHRSEVERHRQVLERTAYSNIGFLAAAIRSIGPGRRNRPGFLEPVFEEVNSVPGIRGVWLTQADGTVIAARTELEIVPGAADLEAARWLEGGVLVGLDVDVGACPYDGNGLPRSMEAQRQSTSLFLFTDAGEIDRELASDLRLRMVIQAVAGVAALGAFLIVRARRRTRRLRTELAVAQERARRNREWALLGAGLAHETKNPLSVVRGIAQHLAGGAGDMEDRAGRADEIVDEVDRVVARINEFLQYSRPIEPRLEAVNLAELLGEMRRLIEPDLMSRHGQLHIECEAIRVEADPGMLRQILLNLLVNAARAIRDGGRIVIRAVKTRRNTLVLELSDNGVGIPADELDKVFEPYYTRGTGGTGLGLAIVRRLVEAHGWSVELESTPDRKTTVRIHGMKPANA